MGNTFMIRTIAYCLYKQDWVDTHTTPNERLAATRNYGLYKTECKELDEEPRSFETFLHQHGYDGSIYASYREFVHNEYFEKEYIENLLQDEDLIKMYREDVDR